MDRIVYLSGLIPADRGRLSQHLRSRLEVEEILAGGAAQTTTLRAGIVIGSGSTSFEMLRQTAELLPILPVSSAMNSLIQPIAVCDAVACLLGCLRPGAPTGPVDIGGPEAVSYAELLQLFTVEAGLLRPRIPLPLVPTAVAARVAPLFSDVPSSLVEALMLSLKHDLVCAPDSPMGRLLPSGYRLLGVRDAIRAALHESPRLAGAAAPLPGDPAWAHGEVYVDDLGVRRRRPRRVWGVNLHLPVRS